MNFPVDPVNVTADDGTMAVNYSFVFSFEQSFEYTQKRQWFVEHWHHCIYYSMAYVVVIFGVQSLMHSRPPFKLRAPLCAWSGMLAIFSLLGAARVLPELVHGLRHRGFGYSVCDTSYLDQNLVSGFWAWAFAISKLPELADTLFIVLRKQPLIFLHWYHHITTLCYVWYSYTGSISTGRWFMALNYTVHGVMYAYYTLKAARVAIPRPVAMFITLGQLTQMLIGIYVNISAYQRKSRGEVCAVSMENIRISLSIYFSFFILFTHFFCNSYVNKKPKNPTAVSESRRQEGKASPDLY